MTPETRAAADHLRTFLNDVDTAFRNAGANPEHHRNAPVIVASGYDLTIGDLHTLLAAVDPTPTSDFMPDSTEATEALMAEPLRIEDVNPIHRVRDYLGVHVRVHGPDTPIATIDERAHPGGFLWQLTAADLGRALVPANRHTTYEGMKALRARPLTDEPCGVIPTPRGRQAVLEYRAIRREQHPTAATDAPA